MTEGQQADWQSLPGAITFNRAPGESLGAAGSLFTALRNFQSKTMAEDGIHPGNIPSVSNVLRVMEWIVGSS
jgi:hypothetical protein